MKKILILSPHPDDETLGCGGLLLKYKKKGYKIDVVYFTKMDEESFSKNQIFKRNKELDLLIKCYKFNTVYHLNYPTTKLDKLNDSELIKKISDCIKKSQPSIILIPSIVDIHTDHNKVTRCALSCVKTFRNNSILKVLFYETLSETNFNFDMAFKPNYFEDIGLFINKKINILKIFKSEFKKHPFPRSKDSVLSLAKLRGSQCNFKYAEAFQIYFSREK